MEIEGLADMSGCIDEFIDVATEAVNETLIPGGQFSVSGHKIKVAGDKPEVGVYFVPAAGTSQRVKVEWHLAENAASKVIGVIPAGLAAGAYTLEIITQYTHGGSSLKEPRVIAFPAQLAVSAPSP